MDAHDKSMIEILQPLIDIANAYDRNNLDDSARKFWGRENEHQNEGDPAEIELYAGRGGKRLLTLQHCLDAREWAISRGLL